MLLNFHRAHHVLISSRVLNTAESADKAHTFSNQQQTHVMFIAALYSKFML